MAMVVSYPWWWCEAVVGWLPFDHRACVLLFSLSVLCVSLTALRSVTIGGSLCSRERLKIKLVLLIVFVNAGLRHPTREGSVMSCNLFDGNWKHAGHGQF